jgi:aerobic-type carbon monoxide dehydrogenase small subunit (CoxS/CutS family)
VTKTTFVVDGQTHTIVGDSDMPLLYALRELGLRGPRFGCGLGQCGACTAIISGRAVRTCLTPVSAASGASIRTLDGLATNGKPNLVQQAFIEEQATLCGYCVNGWIMTAIAALEARATLTDDEIRQALSGLKCRCGSHMSMLRAVRRAANMMSR